jgi:predicted transcriptional regulator
MLAMLTISVAFTTAAYATNGSICFSWAPHTSRLQQLTVSTPIALGIGLHTKLLDQPTRLKIYNFIKANPGVHFRGICDNISLSVGVVQYHLSVLEHAGLIEAYRDGQNKRYFESHVLTMANMQLVSFMRHGTSGKILTILAQNDSAFHKDIARVVGISPQAVTWHMNQIKKAGLVNAEKLGINVKYRLNDINAKKLIIKLTSN